MEKSEKFLEDQTGKKKALLELFARTRAKKNAFCAKWAWGPPDNATPSFRVPN